MARVFVTRKLPGDALDRLRAEFDVDVWGLDRPPSKAEIIERIGDVEGLLCLLTERIDREVMDAAPRLRAISSYSAGLDHIDLEEATRRGIIVSYTPGVLTEAVADLAWALLLSVARRIVEADREVRGGGWRVGWHPTYMLGSNVYGRTIGIVGMGRIGTAVARRARGFNMRILYYSRSRKPEVERELGAVFVGLDELLKEADYVVLSVSLNRETYRMIGERELRLMKPSAYLINISRGAVVDTEALVKALKEGWIAGAGLDVYEEEPLPKDHPLTRLRNVVLTPHIGSATREVRERMAEIAVENLVRSLRGEMPLYPANPEVLVSG